MTQKVSSVKTLNSSFIHFFWAHKGIIEDCWTNVGAGARTDVLQVETSERVWKRKI